MYDVFGEHHTSHWTKKKTYWRARTMNWTIRSWKFKFYRSIKIYMCTSSLLFFFLKHVLIIFKSKTWLHQCTHQRSEGGTIKLSNSWTSFITSPPQPVTYMKRSQRGQSNPDKQTQVPFFSHSRSCFTQIHGMIGKKRRLHFPSHANLTHKVEKLTHVLPKILKQIQVLFFE